MENRLRSLIKEINKLTDEEKIKYLLDHNIYISKLKFGEMVFGLKKESLKKAVFKGRVCGISYNLVEAKGNSPEVWYTLVLEDGTVEIVNEGDIFSSMKEALEKSIK